MRFIRRKIEKIEKLNGWLVRVSPMLERIMDYRENEGGLIVPINSQPIPAGYNLLIPKLVEIYSIKKDLRFATPECFVRENGTVVFLKTKNEYGAAYASLIRVEDFDAEGLARVLENCQWFRQRESCRILSYLQANKSLAEELPKNRKLKNHPYNNLCPS